MLEDKLKEFSVSFLLLISVQEVYTKKRSTEHEKLQRHIWREIIVDTKILVSLLKAKTIRWCPPLLKWYYLKIRAQHEIMKNRNSHRERYVRKGVLRNFVKFSGKRMCQSLFFNKVTGLRPCNFIKKEILAEVFSCEFCEISKNTFSCWAPPVAAYEKIDPAGCSNHRNTKFTNIKDNQ